MCVHVCVHVGVCACVCVGSDAGEGQSVYSQRGDQWERDEVGERERQRWLAALGGLLKALVPRAPRRTTPEASALLLLLVSMTSSGRLTE